MKTTVTPNCFVHDLLEDNILPREGLLATALDNNYLFPQHPPGDRRKVFGNSRAAKRVSRMTFLKSRVNGRVAVSHAFDLAFGTLLELRLIAHMS